MLGDELFPISKEIIEAASSHKAFVEQSHRQFVLEHSYVCEKAQNKITDDGGDSYSDELDDKCCQLLCGRYCRQTIQHPNVLAEATGMLKAIVRIIASKRTVKNGKSFFLSPGPDCFLPLLLIHTPDTTFARLGLAYRVSFSPMEVDFLHCFVSEGDDADGSLCVCPLFAHLGGDNIGPQTDTMTELAIFISQNYQSNSPSWKFELILQYDVSKTSPIELVVTSKHQRATSNTMGEECFSSLMPSRSRRKADQLLQELPAINKLVKSLGNQTMKTSSKKTSDACASTKKCQVALTGNQKAAKKKKRSAPIMKSNGILAFQLTQLSSGLSELWEQLVAYVRYNI